MDIYNEISELKKIQEVTLSLVREIVNNGASYGKEQYYDLTDLEKIFHVSRRTIFKWKAEGKLNFSQIGKKLYITQAELDNFLKKNKIN